jgi:hypothetical protein
VLIIFHKVTAATIQEEPNEDEKQKRFLTKFAHGSIRPLTME